MCQCCIVWATSEAWMICSITMVAFMFLSSSKLTLLGFELCRWKALSHRYGMNNNIGFSQTKQQPIGSLYDFPHLVPQFFHGWIEDIRGHDAVYHQLAKTTSFFFICSNAILKFRIHWIHEQLPSKINRILFCDALASVELGHFLVFFRELTI